MTKHKSYIDKIQDSLQKNIESKTEENQEKILLSDVKFSKKKQREVKWENPFKEFTTYIPDLVYKKIMHWVNKSQYEVSGLGRVIWDEKNKEFIILDAYLLDQKNTYGSTEIDPVSVGELLFDTKDEAGELRWWWHSHVQMGCFWSGTDIAQIASMSKNGWCVATVFNQKNEMKTAFAMKSDNFHLLKDDIKTVIYNDLDPDLLVKWDQEYNNKVLNWQPKYKTTLSDDVLQLLSSKHGWTAEEIAELSLKGTIDE